MRKEEYRGLVLDAASIVEEFIIPADEAFPEKAIAVEVLDPPSEEAVEELQALLNAWCAKQPTKLVTVFE